MTEETAFPEISLKSLEQATLRERIVASILAIATLEPPEEIIAMMQGKAVGAARVNDVDTITGMVHDAAQLGFSAAVMLFKKHLMDALDETKPLTQDLITILRECRVVTTAHHGNKTSSINVVGDTDTVLSLREIIDAINGAPHTPMGCWRGRRISDLLAANNREVEWRRALQESLRRALELGATSLPEDFIAQTEAILSGSIRTENAYDHELAPGKSAV